MEENKRRTRRILGILDKAIPEPQVALDHRDAFQLLVATVLSAQCTDERVNAVTPCLFAQYPGAAKLARADPVELEGIIRPTGFFKSKAKSLIGCARGLCELYGGEVPGTMDELVRLPGVGRKTANVVLGSCFDVPSIVVDTHVKRVAGRLGLSVSDDPNRIEEDLMSLLPKGRWTRGSLQLLLHGRYTCRARIPLCVGCPLRSECPFPGKSGSL